jgi:hypothetical protein
LCAFEEIGWERWSESRSFLLAFYGQSHGWSFITLLMASNDSAIINFLTMFCWRSFVEFIIKTGTEKSFSINSGRRRQREFLILFHISWGFFFTFYVDILCCMLASNVMTTNWTLISFMKLFQTTLNAFFHYASFAFSVVLRKMSMRKSSLSCRSSDFRVKTRPRYLQLRVVTGLLNGEKFCCFFILCRNFRKICYHGNMGSFLNYLKKCLDQLFQKDQDLRISCLF